MKNKLQDLNDHLFAQLESLGDESLHGDKLKEAIERSKAVVGVAGKVIENANLVLDAHKTQLEYGASSKELPKLLEQ